MNAYWGHKSTKILGKRKREVIANDSDSDDSCSSSIATKIPFLLGKAPSNNIYSHYNHVYFNNDINMDTAFDLNKELRDVEVKIKTLCASMNNPIKPIYLHLTTDGGLIYAALSIIDCIESLSIPVYTVIDGFVASAGTLISLAGEKRFMGKNAYMLIHELRGGMWGKMTEIDEEYSNLKKIMTHIIKIYTKKTNIKKKELEQILKKDAIWNLKECLDKGLVDEVYKLN
jgi:ATP-dependent Clp endopeptidase proteolytic subunit ClpP